MLDGDDETPGLSTQLGALVEQMEQAARYMDAARPVSERLTELSYEFEGFAGDIRGLLEGFDCDPRQLDAIESRLDLLYGLKKKYGGSVEEILAFRDRAAEELRKIERSDERARQLQEELSGLLAEARARAEKLSAARGDAAERFTARVMEELAFLDMPSVTLTVRRREKLLSPDGIDELELYISTNVGEEPRSLAKIASGGELARIMLSVKNVMAGRDDIGTLIFDEVDTGVSGRAAQKIGHKLRQVAADRQVIVVTHLAQVAAYAQHHLLISKTARDDRTFTSITPLEGEDRVRELARITGGETLSEIALEHAREMLREADGAFR